MNRIIFLKLCFVAANFYIQVHADVHSGGEESELPKCKVNEVFKIEAVEEDFRNKGKFLKTTTILKCSCFRDLSDRKNFLLFSTAHDPSDPFRKNISYHCPSDDKTEKPVCGRHEICRKDFYVDYGRFRPDEMYLDNSQIYCNCSKRRNCVMTGRNADNTTYQCIEKKYDKPLPNCKEDDNHMVENWHQDVKLNTSLKCSCNYHKEIQVFTKTIRHPGISNYLTKFLWCPKKFIPSERKPCTENQISRSGYLISYGMKNPGKDLKVTEEYCNCGPPPRYNILINEDSVVDIVKYKCVTRVCEENEICKTHATTFLRPKSTETNCRCDGKCEISDLVVIKDNTEGWLYSTCKLSKD